MNILSIFVVIFALFALSRAILRFKGKQISLVWFLVWSVLWMGVIFATLFPPVISVFAVFFGTRTADLVIFAGMIFTFYLLFKFYVKIEKLQQDLTKVVREFALSSANDKKR